MKTYVAIRLSFFCPGTEAFPCPVPSQPSTSPAGNRSKRRLVPASTSGRSRCTSTRFLAANVRSYWDGRRALATLLALCRAT